ncbi:sialidase-like [Sycon ciliatum]|uniref:sialidase-like n=1 Tax=Sycon ciliatum TaxID=27933 RepID=UPI0031F632C2
MAQVKWYSLQGVPDDGRKYTDTGNPSAFVELPRAGSLHGTLDSTLTNTADEQSDYGSIAEDNRERFRSFNNANLTAGDSTIENLGMHSVSNQIGVAGSRSRTVTSTSADSSQHLLIGQASVEPPHSNPAATTSTRPGLNDSVCLSSVLGDLSTTSLQTTPESSFFHPMTQTSHTTVKRPPARHHQAPGVNARAQESPLIGQPATAAAVAHRNLSTVRQKLELGPSVSSSSSVPGSMPDASQPIPRVDQLWQQLQDLNVGPQLQAAACHAGLKSTGEKSAQQQQQCVCDHLRQLGVDTLTALVESLKFGPVPRTRADQSRNGLAGLFSTTAAVAHEQRPSSSSVAASTPGVRQHSRSRHTSSHTARQASKHHPASSSAIGGRQAGSSQLSAKTVTADSAQQRRTGPARSASSKYVTSTAAQSQQHAGSPASKLLTPQPQEQPPICSPQQQLIVLPQPAGGSGNSVDKALAPVQMTAGAHELQTSTSNWFFFPLGQVYTSTAATVPRSTASAQPTGRRSPLPTVVPLSLQDAFQQQMRPFIARSRKRQHTLAVARYKRMMEMQLHSSSSDDDEDSRPPPNRQPSRRHVDTHVGHHHHHHHHRSRSSRQSAAPGYSRSYPATNSARHMSRREIVQNTRRKYNNLPEVQQREEQSKAQREREVNRMNAKLFQQRVTASVLGRSSRR